MRRCLDLYCYGLWLGTRLLGGGGMLSENTYHVIGGSLFLETLKMWENFSISGSISPKRFW